MKCIGMADEMSELLDRLLKLIGASKQLHSLTPYGLVHRPSPPLDQSTLITCIKGHIAIWIWHSLMGKKPADQSEVSVLPPSRTVILYSDSWYSLMALQACCFIQWALPGLVDNHMPMLTLNFALLSWKLDPLTYFPITRNNWSCWGAKDYHKTLSRIWSVKSPGRMQTGWYGQTNDSALLPTWYWNALLGNEMWKVSSMTDA
jgi:hypothetical protein